MRARRANRGRFERCFALWFSGGSRIVSIFANDKVEFHGDPRIVADCSVSVTFSEGRLFHGLAGVGAKMEKVFVGSVLGILK